MPVTDGAQASRPWQIGWWLCWCGTVLLCGGFELQRLLWCLQSPVGWLGWFSDWNPETTLPLLVLLSLPLVLWLYPAAAPARRPRATTAGNPASALPWWWLVLLFVLSMTCSGAIGWRTVRVPGGLQTRELRFADLPPVYHDEYSYLLQAQTFLSGRLSWPPQTVTPDLFHQVHVLNQPRTASRYFPWTGLWLSPFLWLGHPIWGQWLAGGLACVFCSLSLQQLAGRAAAAFGGVLLAVSPGLAVFSNLLLAHHPTLLALSVFLWSFLRMMRSGRGRDALLAGIALALAMLGRPMTAAGFALPFGIWMLRLPFSSPPWYGAAADTDVHCQPTFRQRLRSCLPLLAGLGLPLLLGIGGLLVLNHNITGRWTQSAYQYYTDHYTPRHRYGFENVTRGAALARADNVMDAYDRWASNLTPRRAVANVWSRLQASLLWSLGLAPLLPGLLLATALVHSRRVDSRCALLWWSVITLHLVHVPYWFDGILHWHYVFETAPLLLLLCALGLQHVRELLSEHRRARPITLWVGALVLSALLPGWLDADMFWGASKVSLVVNEQSYSRIRMQQFRDLLKSPRVQRPALVLVDERGADPQLSYIVNPPQLQAEILVCRYPRHPQELQELRQAFADRMFYVFNPQTLELTIALP